MSAAEDGAQVHLNPRRGQIVEMDGARGFVPIEELARHFKVIAQTVRGDVNRLGEDGVLRRDHGGTLHQGNPRAAASMRRTTA